MINNSSSGINTNRIAVVTGANKGIGFFIALQLASSGFFSHVILGCRDAIRGQTAVKMIQDQLLLERQQQQQEQPYKPTTTEISYLPLVVGNEQSHLEFKNSLEGMYGKLDVLVNNAAIAFKGSDPTPFHEQTKPTLDVNYRGTLHLTQTLLPLLQKSSTSTTIIDPRIINVASQSGYLAQLSSPTLQEQFQSNSLTLEQLDTLVSNFEECVMNNTYQQNGWGRSNYGLSKLAVIAATKVLARMYPNIKINCCCPGYCDTDMTSHRGTRHPSEGARNAVIPAVMMPRESCPTGAFFRNYEVSEW